MTKTEILQKLKADLEARGRSTETVRNYVQKVKLFQDHFQKRRDGSFA
jgi:hypothetical protein